MHDELAMLRQLRKEVDRLGEQIDRAIASREEKDTEEKARRRRRTIKLVAWPTGIGVTAFKWFADNRHTAITTASAAALASSATIVLLPQTGAAPDRPDALRRHPAAALPPARPTPMPIPSGPRTPVPHRGAPDHPMPPSTSVLASVTPTVVPGAGSHPLRKVRETRVHPLRSLRDPTPADQTPPCRVYLPQVVHHGLLCSRPGR